MMKSLFEQNGGTYSVVGDYRLPNLTVPGNVDCCIGIWGRRRLSYLKQHRHILYINLLTSGKLDEHLHEIEAAAFELWNNTMQAMSEAQGLTEQLKAENQIEWVGRMNNIRACANEIVQNELIFR